MRYFDMSSFVSKRHVSADNVLFCNQYSISPPSRLSFLDTDSGKRIKLIFQAPAALRLPLGGVGPFLPSDEGIPRERKRRREAERGGEVHNGGGEIN